VKTITMSETRAGSPDGIQVNDYLEGETYTVPEDLADIFTANGWAEETDAPKSEQIEEPANDEKPYAALSDEELAAKVLEHDPAADPAAVAQAIANDRAAVEAALPPAAPTPSVDDPPAKPLSKMNLAELQEAAKKVGVASDGLTKKQLVDKITKASK